MSSDHEGKVADDVTRSVAALAAKGMVEALGALDVRPASLDRIAGIGTSSPLTHAVTAELERIVREQPHAVMHGAIRRIVGLADGSSFGTHLETTGDPAHETIRLACELNEVANDPAALERLAGLTRAHVRTFADTSQLRQPDGARRAIDGVGEWWLDEQFAAYLETLGERGKTSARKIRGRDRDAGPVCRLWFAPSDVRTGLPWLEVLADAVWHDDLGRSIKRERTSVPVGATYPVARFIADATQRGTVVLRDDARQLDFLLDRNEEPIAELENGTLVTGVTLATLEQLQSETKLLSSIEAIALLHYLAGMARSRHMSGGDFTIEIDGGAEELARRLGFTSKKAPGQLLEILSALARLRRIYHGIVIDGFVTHVYDGARGHRQSVLRITIGDPLRPTFGKFLESRLGAALPSAREARMVVPLVGLPPLFGRNNDHAMQANAALEASIYLRQHAEELAERGAVHIPRSQFERFADRAGFARRYLGRTVEKLTSAWTKPGKVRPAFLEEVEEWRFTFGPAHREARESVAEAGKRTIKGRRDGEASAARRVGGPPRARRRK